MGPKLTKFCTWNSLWVVALGSLLLVGGCSSKEGSAQKPEANTARPPANPYGSALTTQQTLEIKVPEPKGDLGLITNSGSLRVGDPESRAIELFPRPLKKAFDHSELPPMLTKPFRGRGWQSETTSFGTILLENKIVAAVWVQDDADRQDVNDLVEKYRKEHNDQEPQLIVNRSVSYWFWTEEDRTLMICLAQNRDKTLGLTLAVGESTVMRTLRMDPASATADARKAEEILGPSEKSTNP